MTGLAKKKNPYSQENRFEWIQCCRVGLGRPEAHPPPVTYMPSGVPAYSAPRTASAPYVTAAYAAQYRSKPDDEDDDLEGNEGNDLFFGTMDGKGGSRIRGGNLAARNRTADNNNNKGNNKRKLDSTGSGSTMSPELDKLLFEARGIRPARDYDAASGRGRDEGEERIDGGRLLLERRYPTRRE